MFHSRLPLRPSPWASQPARRAAGALFRFLVEHLEPHEFERIALGLGNISSKLPDAGAVSAERYFFEAVKVLWRTGYLWSEELHDALRDELPVFAAAITGIERELGRGLRIDPPGTSRPTPSPTSLATGLVIAFVAGILVGRSLAPSAGAPDERPSTATQLEQGGVTFEPPTTLGVEPPRVVHVDVAAPAKAPARKRRSVRSGVEAPVPAIQEAIPLPPPLPDWLHDSHLAAASELLSDRIPRCAGGRDEVPGTFDLKFRPRSDGSLESEMSEVFPSLFKECVDDLLTTFRTPPSRRGARTSQTLHFVFDTTKR